MMDALNSEPWLAELLNNGSDAAYEMLCFNQNPNSFSELLELIRKVDHEFVPPLSTKVDLEKWIQKVATNAVSIVMQSKSNGEWVGAAMFYCNYVERAYAYWTCFGVLSEHRSRGLAMRIERAVIEYCRRVGKLGIEAMLRRSNVPLLRFHQAFGFESTGVKPDPSDPEVKIEIRLTF